MSFIKYINIELPDKLPFNNYLSFNHHHHNRLWPFFRDHPSEPVPEENFWTPWCKGRLTEADTQTTRLGATPSRLTSAQLHHPPFFTGRMPFLPPNQQCHLTGKIIVELLVTQKCTDCIVRWLFYCLSVLRLLRTWSDLWLVITHSKPDK